MDFKNNIISNVVKDMLSVKEENLLFDSIMMNAAGGNGDGAGGNGDGAGGNGDGAGGNGDGAGGNSISIGAAGYFGDSNIFDYGALDTDYNVTISSYGGGGGGGYAATSTIDLNELYRIKEEQIKEEELRSKHETLQEAYDNYQLIKKLVEDTESDKYIKNRYKDFE